MYQITRTFKGLRCRHPHFLVGLCECAAGEHLAFLLDTGGLGEAGEAVEGHHEQSAGDPEGRAGRADVGAHARAHLPVVPVQGEVRAVPRRNALRRQNI